MGALKDIYDIFTDVASKTKAHRLHQSQGQSREGLEAYAATLEVSVSELRLKMENLEREHVEEVARLTDEKAAAKAQRLKAVNDQLRDARAKRAASVAKKRLRRE